MGKALIIKGANFAANAVGEIEINNNNIIQFIQGGITAQAGGIYGFTDETFVTKRARTMGTIFKIPKGGTLTITGIGGYSACLVGYPSQWTGSENKTINATYSSSSGVVTSLIKGDVLTFNNPSEAEYFALFIGMADNTQELDLKKIPTMYYKIS